MDKKILVLVSVIVLIGAVSLGYFLGGKKSASSPNTQTVVGLAGNPAQSTTKTAVPANVSVPGVSSTVSADVAKPINVSAAAPGVTAQLRTFSIAVNNDQFSPNTVIVNPGDTVRLTFTAQDKTYDFTQPDYGLKQTLTQGKQAIVEFQAVDTGKFTFYCSSCGGPDKGPVGYIIVVSK